MILDVALGVVLGGIILKLLASLWEGLSRVPIAKSWLGQITFVVILMAVGLLLEHLFPNNWWFRPLW
jgi:hypothetical protein